jgi:sirohydrochlorin cobaltochelatase
VLRDRSHFPRIAPHASPDMNGVVLFAHGSRDPQWAAPFREIEKRVAAASPQSAVTLAFLETMSPTLPQAVDALVARGCDRITVAPLFMAQGAHLKRDLAALADAARTRHPQVNLETLPAAGEAPGVMDAIAAWVDSGLRTH